MLEELARLTQMNFSGSGCALLTRFPVLHTEQILFRMLHGRRPHLLLLAVLDIGGRKVLVLNTHFDHVPDAEQNRSFVEEINQAHQRLGALPVVLLGDFNSLPESDIHQQLQEHFRDTWERAGYGEAYTRTGGAFRHKRIDYVYVSKDANLRETRSVVFHTDASDHFPVITDLTITDSP